MEGSISEGQASQTVQESRISKLDQNDNDFDVDALLNQTRSKFLRRLRPLWEPPEFVKRLSPFVEVEAGQNISFEVQWKGCPQPTIKWYKDDDEVIENDRYHIDSKEAGVLTLTVDCATKDDEGAYKCKAENSEGVSSTTGYLSVTGDFSDKPLSSQPRSARTNERVVSEAPHLRTITEQKSVEEREAEEYDMLPPSPINEFIDTYAFRRGHAWPMLGPCDVEADGKDPAGDDSGSDTSVDSQDFDRVPCTVTVGPADDTEHLLENDSTNKDTLDKDINVYDHNSDVDRPKSVVHVYINKTGPGVAAVTDFEENSINANQSSHKTDTGSHESVATQLSKTIETTSISDTADVCIVPETMLGSYKSPPSANCKIGDIHLTKYDRALQLDTCEMPWLFYLAFACIATLLGTTYEVSPCWFVLVIAIISLVSFVVFSILDAYKEFKEFKVKAL